MKNNQQRAYDAAMQIDQTPTRKGRGKSRTVTMSMYDDVMAEIHSLLDRSIGLHTRLARESGVPQSVVSRTFLRKGVPTLRNAMDMLQWLRQHSTEFGALRRESADHRVEGLIARAASRSARRAASAQQRPAIR